MKKFITVLFIIILIGNSFSCASYWGELPPPSAKNPYRPLPNSKKSAVIDTAETTFNTNQVIGFRTDNRNVSNRAYNELLKDAQEKHGDNIDIFDITWTEVGKITEKDGKWVAYIVSAFGKVVTLDSKRFVGVENALIKASGDAMKNVSKNSVIAIVYITAQDKGIIIYISSELEFILVKEGYIIANRSQLDLLRNEQNFQLSGEVDDASAVSIGKILGANVIITGQLEGIGNLRRLRLRVLNVETGQVIGVASEQL